MVRLWWVCAILLCIRTPLPAQHSDQRPVSRSDTQAKQEYAPPCVLHCTVTPALPKTVAPALGQTLPSSLMADHPAAQMHPLDVIREESQPFSRQGSRPTAAQRASSAGKDPASPLTRYEAGLDLLARVPSPDPLTVQEGTSAPSRKSAGLAVLYSLLLPGMGELYAEGFASGKYFLIAEGVLWLGYAGMEIHANDLRDGARAFAAARAGVDPAGKDDDFYVNVGNFNSLEEYNEKKLRDREPEKLYDPLAGYSWRWDTDLSRQTFRDQRISSENWYNNQKFVAAAIVINHIISAVNAARAAIAYNNAQDDALGALQFSSRLLGGAGQPHGVLITVAREF